MHDPSYKVDKEFLDQVLAAHNENSAWINRHQKMLDHILRVQGEVALKYAELNRLTDLYDEDGVEVSGPPSNIGYDCEVVLSAFTGLGRSFMSKAACSLGFHGTQVTFDAEFIQRGIREGILPITDKKEVYRYHSRCLNGPLPHLSLDRSWLYLQLKYNGEEAIRATFEPVAKVLWTYFRLRSTEPIFRRNGDLVLQHNTWGTSYERESDWHKTNVALRAVARWGQYPDSEIHELDKIGKMRSGESDNIDGLGSVRVNKEKTDLRVNKDFGRIFLAFVSEFKPEE